MILSHVSTFNSDLSINGKFVAKGMYTVLPKTFIFKISPDDDCCVVGIYDSEIYELSVNGTPSTEFEKGSLLSGKGSDIHGPRPSGTTPRRQNE